MTFINTVPEDQAEGATKELYEQTKDDDGQIPNFIKAFSYRPDVLEHFNAMLGSLKSNMDLRRYELVTIAAARELTSSYCMLAHGSYLIRDFVSPEQLRAIAENPESSDVDDADKAIMAFATKVVRDATSVTADDVDALRKHGLSEADIFDVAAAAAARCFISKTADAMGALPDPSFGDLTPELQKALVVGRPISG